MDPNTIAVVPAIDTEEISNPDNVVEPATRHAESTDSLVTIRLSIPEPSVSEDASLHDEIAVEDPLEEFPKMDDEQDFGARESNRAVYEHQAPMLAEEAKIVQRIHRNSLAAMHRESMLTLTTVEEGSSDAASSTIRSRSDSSGTYSSTGSAHVDWDELDKSEEQAPRDEGSDEV